MALVLADRVKETTSVTGTGPATLLGASTGFQAFAVIGNTNTTYYTIAGQTTSEWEVGIGTYSTTGPTLTRTTVLANSAGTQPTALTFSSGTKDVFVTYPAGKSINLDSSNNASALGTIASGAWQATTIGINYGGTGQTTQQAALTALSGTQTTGQYLRSNGTNTLLSAIQAADVPTLNQNTTGSAATLTTARTIAITGDLAYTSGSFNGSANVTGAGTLATVNTNVGSFTNATLTVNGKGLITAASSGTAPVTSVTGTAPVTSSGGTTPAISMAAATASVNGYLTSTDWTTFNNKGSGTVTSVTGTAPVSSSGGTTPAISMAAATASVDGYLTSTDWTTFNNKGSGTVTSVAALTLGTTGTDLSSTVANGTTTPVITLNVPTASATNRGALSAADWTTFNGKGSGTVTSVTATTPVSSTGGTTPVISMPAATTSVSGYLTSTDWNTFNGKGSGTVTSVTGTSPVASSGGATPAISLSAGYGDTLNPYASKTANYILAAPNGTAGVPTFRAVVAADIPTLNQNTTGTASNVTGTVAIANGGTGQTTASAAFNALSPVTTTGDLILGNGVNSATRLAIGTNGYVLTSNGTTATWSASSGGGISTGKSIAMAMIFGG